MTAPDRSIAAAIEAGRRELVGRTATPALDARVLAGCVLGLDASALIAYGENLVDAARLRRLASMVARRKAGEPIAYIVGAKEFCGLRIAVDRRVLVPRAETEELVARAVADLRGKAPRVLELGTGSGAVACALADALPAARIVATDIDADALDVAAENVGSLGFADRIDLRRGDLFAAVERDARFDAIVANLPYVAEREDEPVEQGVRDFEPPAALFGGDDGLAVYRRMLPDAPAHLAAGGRVYLECGPRNALDLAALAKRAFPGEDVAIVDDLAGRARMVIVA